jgi:hypothetical protein
MIIGLTGTKRVGKDTFANYLIKNNNFIKFAFADCLKEVCASIFLLSEEQVNGKLKETIDPRWGLSPRVIFQRFGTEIFRDNLKTFFPEIKLTSGSIWVERFKKFYEQNKYRNIVITDIRFPDEAMIVKEFGGVIVKIKRDTGFKDDHKSENLFIMSNHLIYNNKSIESFHMKIEKLLMKSLLN